MADAHKAWFPVEVRGDIRALQSPCQGAPRLHPLTSSFVFFGGQEPSLPAGRDLYQ